MYRLPKPPTPTDYFSWKQSAYDFGAYFTPEEYLLWRNLTKQCRQVGEAWRVGIPSSAQAMTASWMLLIQKHPRRLDTDAALHFFERLQIIRLLAPVEGAPRRDGILVCQFALNPHRILAKKLLQKDRTVITVTDRWAKLPTALPQLPRTLYESGNHTKLYLEIRQRFDLSECIPTLRKKLLEEPQEYSRGLGLLVYSDRDLLLPCWPGLSAAHPFSLEEKYPSSFLLSGQALPELRTTTVAVFLFYYKFTFLCV